MQAWIELVPFPQVHVAHVEGIPEENGEPGDRDLPVSSVPESEIVEKIDELLERVIASRVPGEREADERSSFGIDLLRFAGAAVQIADGRRTRIEPLLQPLLDAALRFLPQVTDVVGGDHGLDVGSQPATSGIHVDAFAGEVDGDALVDEFSEIRPVFEVAGRAVDLVDDESVRLTLPESLQDLAEDWPTPFRGGLLLLEPTDDQEPTLCGKARDLFPLGKQRDALALFRRGDPEVAEKPTFG